MSHGSGTHLIGMIRADEAYSKQTLMQRLGISQKFWDKLLDEGLPYAHVGHSRWVTGQELIEHLRRNAVRKATFVNDAPPRPPTEGPKLS